MKKSLSVGLSVLIVISVCSCSLPQEKMQPVEKDSVAMTKDTILIKSEKIKYSANTSKTKQGIKIDIKEHNTSLQSIDYRYDTEFEPNPSSRRDSVILRDVTFDGHDDLLIYLGSFGNQGVEYFDCYVWNDGNPQFVHAPTFKDIQNPAIINGCIYSNARESAATYIYERWAYHKGRFTATARLVQQYSADRTCLYDEYFIDEKRQKKDLSREQISKFWLNVIN